VFAVYLALNCPAPLEKQPPREIDLRIIRLYRESGTRNEAFVLLMRTYKERLYWHIRKMVVDHDETDDLLQNTFIKAWKGLENFREEAGLYTWLYRIATNECISFLNHKRRRLFLPIGDISDELLGKLQATASPNGDQIEYKLQQAVLRLPEKQRLVFNMKYYDDLSYEEISDIVGTSVGALKASYHHAVKKIESFLSEH
jgi:RNA polymerase sigma-70 factor (ECF subfamily)